MPRFPFALAAAGGAAAVTAVAVLAFQPDAPATSSAATTPAPAAAAPAKPIVRTVVEHRTVHVTRHARPAAAPSQPAAVEQPAVRAAAAQATVVRGAEPGTVVAAAPSAPIRITGDDDGARPSEYERSDDHGDDGGSGHEGSDDGFEAGDD